MKSKLVIASLLLAGACAANLNAQEKTNYYTPKWSDNIFVSVGGGIHAINNDGFNKMCIRDRKNTEHQLLWLPKMDFKMNGGLFQRSGLSFYGTLYSRRTLAKSTKRKSRKPWTAY